MKLIKSGFVIERMELKNNHLKPAKFKLKQNLQEKPVKSMKPLFLPNFRLRLKAMKKIDSQSISISISKESLNLRI